MVAKVCRLAYAQGLPKMTGENMNSVLITGSNKGIGLEMVKIYLDQGYPVIACCRNPAGAAELTALAASNSKLSVEAVDVGDPSSVVALKQRLGDAPIDILLNNAGTAGPAPEMQSTQDIDFDGYLDTFKVNTMAPLHMLQQFRANLKAGTNPKAVTITSQMGAISFEFINMMYAYCASKAAVNKIMRMIGDDMKQDGIAVQLVHPGWVKTDMGGPTADLEPIESAQGIVETIGKMTLDDSTAFHKWNGEVHGW